MTETEIKDQILKLFQRSRQKPDADFDESHFLDFLTYPPHKINAIKNTFRGSGRYYRFMDTLELEFGICFKMSDLDKHYSIDSLTKKVLERIQKVSGNKIILKQRKERKDSYYIDAILIFALVALYSWLGIHWLTITITVVFARAFYWIYGSRNYERQHIKKLELRLNNEK